MFRLKDGLAAGLVAAILGLVASSVAGQAEEPSEPVAADHVESIEVRLVNLEVFVTDRDGGPITDLTVEDFEVKDDGDRVEITHFERPSGLPPRQGTRGEETPPPAATKKAASETAVTPELPLLVFYFDALHLTRDRREPVLDALERFIWQQRFPPERVMVIIQTQGVQMLAPFGSSRERLSQALEAVAATSTSGEIHEDDRGEMIDAVFSRFGAQETAEQQRIPGARAESSQLCRRHKDTWRDLIQAFAQQASARGAETLANLRSLIDLLGALPGSKVLVYVSGGLEIEPAVDVAQHLGRYCPGLLGFLQQATRPSNLGRTFKDLVLDASFHRITFYALEAAGARTVSESFAETEDSEASDAAQKQLQRSGNPQTGLTFLAEETGGRAVLEMLRFDGPLRALAEDLGAFYSLAYSPPAEPDGRERTVKVKVRDSRKPQLRYRTSYRNVASGKTLADRLTSALLLGWADNPLGVEVGFGDVRAHPENDAILLVPLRFTLSLDRLLRIAEEGGSRAKLRLMLAARHESGNVLGPLTQRYGLALPGGSESLGERTFEFTAEMVPGSQELVLGFVDEHSGEASFLIESLELPAW